MAVHILNLMISLLSRTHTHTHTHTHAHTHTHTCTHIHTTYTINMYTTQMLVANTTLTSLNIACNKFGEASFPRRFSQCSSQLLCLPVCLFVCLFVYSSHCCCHPTQAGGKLIQEGTEENRSLVTFDLRLTEVSQESEYCINQVVKDNQDRLKAAGGR